MKVVLKKKKEYDKKTERVRKKGVDDNHDENVYEGGEG